MTNNCIVGSNCKRYFFCDFCDNYNEYQPRDYKILSPAQIEKKEKKKQAKKEKKNSSASLQGKRNKRNGSASERELKKLLLSWKLECDKVPLSGALKTSFNVTVDGKDSKIILCSDLWVKINGKQYTIENKRRQNIDSFYKMVDKNIITHIKGFCYVMNQNIFMDILNGMLYDFDTIEDKRFKSLHGFFGQDNSDIVTLKSPYKPFIFCVTENAFKEIMKW